MGLRDTTGDVREGKFSDVSGRSDMLHVMAWELQPVSRALTTTVAGEIVDPAGLAARAAEVAARQRSPETRRTYAAVYRTFCAFLGPDAAAEDLTPATVRAYRDALERAGRSPARSPSTCPRYAVWPLPLAPTPTSGRCVRPAWRAAAAHARPPHPPGQARPRAAAPARLRWATSLGGGQAADLRCR